MFKRPNAENTLSLIERLPVSQRPKQRLSRQFLDILESKDSIHDWEFDQILPSRFRAISEVHWTPIEVARKIALSLKDRPQSKFIDVGSGAGKLCLLLALMSELEIYGIEQRLDLVKISREICEENAPGRVKIMSGNMLDLDWNQYDIFYLYNPFQEHLCGVDVAGLIDGKIQPNRKTFSKYTNEVFYQLTLLKPRKRVITYHGYGGRMPASLKPIQRCIIGTGTLVVWEKV